MPEGKKQPKTPWKYLAITRKREEAQGRQEVYDGLSLDEKLALARSRRGKSEREIRRLMQPEGADS